VVLGVSRHVPGNGPLTARLIFIGEAPGENEERTGQPFVGAAGYRMFTEWMLPLGLNRQSIRVENLAEYRPPGNKIEAFGREYLEECMEHLHRRMAALVDPWLIVPTGNYALYALTGLGRVYWHRKEAAEARPGILDWRGSILQYVDRRNRCIKLIPMLHPAATFFGRSPGPPGETWCRRDLQRIKAELEFRDIKRPEREHYIKPSFLVPQYVEPTLPEVVQHLRTATFVSPQPGLCLSRGHSDPGVLEELV